MGAAGSKIEDDKALLVCRERKRFVRQALDGRCSLAAAHVAYIQSLRNTGTALRKFIQPEVTSESSLYTTSTSATPEPLALTDKSNSHFSNSSPSLSQHVETSEPFSPVPSPPNSARVHVNHMKAVRISSRTIEERPMVSVTATVKHTESELDASAEGAPWDYFELFHPIDNQLSFQDAKGSNRVLEDAEVITRLREEEGVPELEEEGGKPSTNERDDDFTDSDSEFDKPSSEPLVKMYRNRNEVLDESVASETEQQNVETVVSNGLYETDETSEVAPSKTTSSVITLPMNGKHKEFGSENKLPVKDFFSCVKEIDDLFLKASESGREVPRMLEANKVRFRPLFPEEIAHKSKISMYLTACFACCTEETQLPQAPPQNDVKYLTWHRSASSRSSSSRNPLGPTSKDEVDDPSSNLFGSICMNSGSHASTLDRLYAWERKLYDEVKASGIIRREYDMKCKLLRDQDSRNESRFKIDKTRASVKDLHSRIRVAIHRIDSISKTIEELRDKELQPQLEELIGGLTRMWRMMLDCHKQQYNLIASASNNGTTKLSSTRSESYRQATILLQFELTSLCSSFTKWMQSHKSYLESINGWLLKCIFLIPVRQKSSRRKNAQFSPRRSLAPPIFVTCRDWLKLLDELPTREVSDAIKDLVDVTAHFLPRPEKGHHGKKRGGNYEELQRNESMVDWSLNYDTLQSCLVVLLDRMKSFADVSVSKYEDLQSSIDEARAVYDRDEKGGMR
ncbi:uncharacterized protein A4U43_UnF11050 [Asparagus officinalis]|uniref:DUF632 domain-containing protein n=1 Tax=Asparagus officinalis TaxID=4686 RepID=A0A1R3L5B6_ASPOF|nr:uncharacterized protein LOC109828195 [Asparagus officinalis]XP_020250814.1 uncharacterized protein LOC109828195 [Asparagus officinalis]ONK54811.1 uncharacterized protein A4U43_UnF11050 [Asparagus officinalis]